MRILITDDEESIRQIMVVMLKAAKHWPFPGDACIARRSKSYVTRTFKTDKINTCRHFRSPG